MRAFALMLCMVFAIGCGAPGGGRAGHEGDARPALATFEAAFFPPVANNWQPKGCGWDAGVSLGTHDAADNVAPWILITQRGCSIESSPVQVPPSRSAFIFAVRTDLQGHACSDYDCAALSTRWLDANRQPLASAEFDVGPIKIEEPIFITNGGGVPAGATFVVVSVRGPHDMRDEARVMFTSLALHFE